MLKWSEYDSMPIVKPIFISTKTSHEEKDISSVYCYGGEKGETYSELIQKYEDPLMWSFDMDDDTRLDVCTCRSYYNGKLYDTLGDERVTFLIFYKDADKYFIDLGYVYQSVDADDDYGVQYGEYYSEVHTTMELNDYKDNIYKHFYIKCEEILHLYCESFPNILYHKVMELGERNAEYLSDEIDDDEVNGHVDLENRTFFYLVQIDEYIRFKDDKTKREMVEEYVKIRVSRDIP